jgi:hypothetical protein
VFENKVLRKTFGPKSDEVTWEWRRLHNEELNDLYSSTNIVRVIKSRRIRWAEHVARMGDREERTRLWVWKPEGKRPIRRPRRRKEVILKCILKKLDWKAWSGLIWIKDRDRWRAIESAVTNLRVP